MMNKQYLIRTKPKFLIQLKEDVLFIKKDHNSLNNKEYKINELRTVHYEKAGVTPSTVLFRFFVGYLIPLKNRYSNLIIETIDKKDTFYIEDYNSDTLQSFIDNIQPLLNE